VFNGSDLVATLNLAGSYTSADFGLSSDGHGGTDIGVVASGPAPIRGWSSATLDQNRATPFSGSSLPGNAKAPAMVGGTRGPVTNASDIVYTGTYFNGIVLSNPATQNPATIAASSYVTNETTTHSGDAIYGVPAYSWTISNLGTVSTYFYSIHGPIPGDGVHLTAGGVLINGQSGSGRGLIDGYSEGVDISGGSGTVTNFGGIYGNEGVLLAAGGIVTNFGTMYGELGVVLGAGGNVTNFGTIKGRGAGVDFPGAVTNAGTVTNAGAIIGSSGTAVQFGGGDDLLVADPGAAFVGKVDGGGSNNTLELAAGAGPGLLSGLGTNFVNFGSVVFDPGAPWTVTLDNPAAFTGTISGFSKGDFIDLTGRAATDVSYAGRVLTVLNGPTVVATLNLVGSYTSADFTLSPDGQGGTDIGTHITSPPNPPPPGGPTADMILRNGDSGDYKIYDLGNNAVLGSFPLGQVGLDWQFAGLGNFNGTDTSDMLLRDGNTGAFVVYDISNNSITATASLGQVGLDWQVAGFGSFNGAGRGTDMMMRNINTGAFVIYDIANNMVTSTSDLGQVGLDWQVAGFGSFNGAGRGTDMMTRNINTGAFVIYDIANNMVTSTSDLGQVGLDWQVAGFGDFNGDGTTDMMLRNAVGTFEIYDIQGNQVTTTSPIGQVGLEWQVAGFGPIAGPNTSDMVLRNTQTGAFEVYDIANNQLTGAASLGQVGLDWQVGGIAPDPLTHAPTILGQ
jgi:hypothetical protein